MIFDRSFFFSEIIIGLLIFLVLEDLLILKKIIVINPKLIITKFSVLIFYAITNVIDYFNDFYEKNFISCVSGVLGIFLYTLVFSYIYKKKFILFSIFPNTFSIVLAIFFTTMKSNSEFVVISYTFYIYTLHRMDYSKVLKQTFCGIEDLRRKILSQRANYQTENILSTQMNYSTQKIEMTIDENQLAQVNH